MDLLCDALDSPSCPQRIELKQQPNVGVEQIPESGGMRLYGAPRQPACLPA
jgi:hypothetical protein